MSWHSELKLILHASQQFAGTLWGSEYNVARRYVRQLVIVCVVVVVGLGSFFGYRWYVMSREQQVQLMVAESFQDYYRVIQSDNRDELARLESLLGARYREHGYRMMGLLFLVLQTDVQLKQEKYQEALETLGKVADALPKTSSLSWLVKTKRALVQLDMQDEVLNQIGLQELDQLAHDKNNTYRDMALFYLGRYYWAHDKVDIAKKVWQELVDDPLYTQAFGSPWVREAHEALSQRGEE